MDIDEHNTQEHPEELLAGYVEGSADPAERQTVESHLATCHQCRDEVELATSAMAALASLPELESPGLAGADMDGFRRTPSPAADDAFEAGPAPVGKVRVFGRRMHWDRVALGAGLAAAAGLFVIFAVIGITRTGGGGQAGLASRGTPAARGLPPVIDRGANYSPASLQALTTQLRGPAERNQALTKAPNDASFGSVGGTTPQASPGAQSADAATTLSCFQTGTGMLPTAKAIYFESAAFNGTPAFIGGFVVPPAASGARPHLIVAAVSQSGCQPLYEVRQTL